MFFIWKIYISSIGNSILKNGTGYYNTMIFINISPEYEMFDYKNCMYNVHSVYRLGTTSGIWCTEFGTKLVWDLILQYIIIHIQKSTAKLVGGATPPGFVKSFSEVGSRLWPHFGNSWKKTRCLEQAYTQNVCPKTVGPSDPTYWR